MKKLAFGMAGGLDSDDLRTGGVAAPPSHDRHADSVLRCTGGSFFSWKCSVWLHVRFVGSV